MASGDGPFSVSVASGEVRLVFSCAARVWWLFVCWGNIMEMSFLVGQRSLLATDLGSVFTCEWRWAWLERLGFPVNQRNKCAVRR